MSDIVLTASVRQNLLSLQSTADLLATTQNRLATGKKVNSALDNPTNFFTAASLDARASDINNLLDGIGNGVQVLQAANTGITSLQKLIDSAKSIANQALQSQVGYTKSSLTTGPNAGANGANLLGSSTPATAAAPVTGSGFSAVDLSSGTVSFNLNVDGTSQAISLDAAAVTSYNTAHGTTLNAASLSAQDMADLINDQFGSAAVTVSGGQLRVASATTGATSQVTISGYSSTAAAGATGLANASTTGTAASGGLAGQTLTIASTTGGPATSITFGTGTGEVSTINQLNAALLANNLQASIGSTGAITITTANDAASSTIGALGGTATDPGGLFAGLSGSTPVADPNSQATRASLVSQYNNIINQIKTTSQDASYNGVNLLNGDQLKLIFNETGTSTLNITGINLDPAGLGLGALNAGTDFIDNVSTNKVLDSLNYASSFLRSQASTLGSNLSIVQIRQDFSKNLINVLQTGSTNLTIADTNEEAANSQALSTRQSIAVSALALANQSQQSVLKLLQ